MKDSQFMTGAEKLRVLQQWEQFLKSGLAREKFTKALYHHLINHCSFIAHYDINGFYDTYFTRGCATAKFLEQFDDKDGMVRPKSAELGMDHWYTDERYDDINPAMCVVARKYLPQLMLTAFSSQRAGDIAEAQRLLARHGIELKI